MELMGWFVLLIIKKMALKLQLKKHSIIKLLNY